MIKFRKDVKVVFFLIVALFSAGFAAAQDALTKPYNFSPGTTASSGQVNANFDILYQKFNELSARVAALESGMLSKLKLNLKTVCNSCMGNFGCGCQTPDSCPEGYFLTDMVEIDSWEYGDCGAGHICRVCYKITIE